MSSAHAVEFYNEFGGGVSQISGATPFFDSSTARAPAKLGRGLAATFTLAGDVSRSSNWVHFHLGLQHKYLTGTGSGTSHSLQATYPLLRVEVKRLYFGVGVTPFVWKDGLTRAAGSIAGLGEVGFLFPITPEIAFGTHLALQAVSTSGAQSPKPAADVGFYFRLYLGSIRFGKADDSGGSSSDYKGWRYFKGLSR
ncbi:MAG: hypothetical protein H7222_05890 [Methylotenera sp.]|nr:hypothetical protein [Oligoflexia bacterium]